MENLLLENQVKNTDPDREVPNEEKKATLVLQQENLALKHAMVTRDIQILDAQIAAEKAEQSKRKEKAAV